MCVYYRDEYNNIIILSLLSPPSERRALAEIILCFHSMSVCLWTDQSDLLYNTRPNNFKFIMHTLHLFHTVLHVVVKDTLQVITCDDEHVSNVLNVFDIK